MIKWGKYLECLSAIFCGKYFANISSLISFNKLLPCNNNLSFSDIFSFFKKTGFKPN